MLVDMKTFMNGEEMTMIKNFIKTANTLVTVGIGMGYLVLLDLLPRFTIMMTVLAAVALYATHVVKKWARE